LPLLASARAGLAISTVGLPAGDEKARIGYAFAGLAKAAVLRTWTQRQPAWRQTLALRQEPHFAR